MDTSTKRATTAHAQKKSSLKTSAHNGRSKAHIGEAANHLLHEGKNWPMKLMKKA
ncbi:hypothetical protein [Legionella tunisiensis]|uniref:hypothetical protein n=1 Tax=Legionella tunisiensis TaxID=1034944 RepID=UPI0002F66CA1|nr:hypothetical protein [Legionella tunisiensis]